MEQQSTTQNRVLAFFQSTWQQITSFLVDSVPVWLVFFVTIVLTILVVGVHVKDVQSTQTAVSAATRADQQRQLVAASYVPSLAACNQYAPKVDGPSLAISAASGTQLCVATATLPTNIYSYGNNAGVIQAPGGVAVTDYAVYEGQMVPNYSAQNTFVGDEAVASSSDRLSLDIVPLSDGMYAEPLFVEVYYLPPNAPAGANAYFGERALAQLQTAPYAGIANIGATDSRFGMPVFTSTEAALERFGK